MRNQAILLETEIDAYIITSYDEHLSEQTADYDKRLQHITGFTGNWGFAVVSSNNEIFENMYKFTLKYSIR